MNDAFYLVEFIPFQYSVPRNYMDIRRIKIFVKFIWVEMTCSPMYEVFHAKIFLQNDPSL